MNMIDIQDLHVYGQGIPHDDVYIAGTRKALEQLRESIEFALNDGKDTVDFFVTDGEGYKVHVYCVPENVMNGLRYPYYDDDYIIGNTKTYPWQLKDTSLDTVR